MKNNKFALSFILPLLGAIPVVLTSIFEQQINAAWGNTVWIVLFVISMIFVFALSILPFVGIFKGMFGGKGYNFFWGTGKLAKQILASGSDATATIVSIGENSGGGTVTINDQPLLNIVLQIDDNYAPTYEVSFDTIVPRSAVPQFQPGASFAVKVDRADKNNVVLNQQLSGALSNSSSMPIFKGKDWTENDHRLLKESGIDALAKLISIEDTGKSEDFNPIIKIGYEVYIPGESSYDLEKEIAMPTDVVLKLKTLIGKSYKAKVHPDDRNKITVKFIF